MEMCKNTSCCRPLELRMKPAHPSLLAVGRFGVACVVLVAVGLARLELSSVALSAKRERRLPRHRLPL